MARGLFLSRDSIKAVAGNDGNYKRGVEVQASNKMTEVAFSGDMLIHGKAKCSGSSPSDHYLLKFEINPDLPGARPQADCSCPAAQRGICKHVVALLLIRADQVAAEERLKASERLAAGRAEASGKAVLASEAPPPPPEAFVEATPSSEVAAVFKPSITNALAAGSAMSKEGGASSSIATKRTLPPWMQPKAKPEKAKAEKKGRTSESGTADIRTLLTPKKRPLEVVAKAPPKRRARKLEVAQASSGDEEQGEDDVTDDVAPKQRATRKSGAAAKRMMREEMDEDYGGAEPEANEKGQQGEAGIGNTLGDGWGTFLLGKHEEYEQEARNVATTSREDARESEALWDGEDESQEPSHKSGQGRKTTAAAREPKKPLNRKNRKVVLEDESEDNEGARPARQESREADQRQAYVAEALARQTESVEAVREAPKEPSQAPKAPLKKQSVYSLKSWKVDLSDLNEDDARQLQSTLSEPTASLPQEPTLAHPEASLRQEEATLLVSKPDEPQARLCSASVSETNVAAGSNLGSLPNLSDAAEENAEEESDPEQDVVEDQNGLGAFGFFGMTSYINKSNKKGTKKTKVRKSVPQNESLPGTSGVTRPQDSTHVDNRGVSRQDASRSVANLAEKAEGYSPSESIRLSGESLQRPVQRPIAVLSRLPSTEPTIEKATSSLSVGPPKKKIKFGDLAPIPL